MLGTVFILFILGLQIAVFVSGFANWMTKDFCDRALVVGEIIMNNEVISSDERSIRVFRDSVELVNNSAYIPSEKLLVELSDPTGQYVFESLTATFEKGGCDGHRFSSSTKKAYLLLPAADSCADVSIVSGWALGHEEVKITYPFILSCETKGIGETAQKLQDSGEDKDIKKHWNESMKKVKKSKKVRRRMAPGDHIDEDAAAAHVDAGIAPTY
jgi:hypothetical protein